METLAILKSGFLQFTLAGVGIAVLAFVMVVLYQESHLLNGVSPLTHEHLGVTTNG